MRSAKASRRFVLALCLGVVPPAAQAQSPPREGEPCSDAERLVASGMELRRQGSDAAALEVFRALDARCPSPRLSVQRGLAEHALGLWQPSITHLERGLSAVGDPWVEARRGPIEAVRDEIRARLSTDASRSAPPPPPPPPLPPPRARRPDPRVDAAPPGSSRAAGFVLLGVGAAVFGAGVVQWVRSAVIHARSEGANPDSPEPYGAWSRFWTAAHGDARSEPDELCVQAQRSPLPDAVAVRDLCDDQLFTRNSAWVLGLSGAVIAGVGTALLLRRPAPPRRGVIALYPSLGPTGAALGLSVALP